MLGKYRKSVSDIRMSTANYHDEEGYLKSLELAMKHEQIKALELLCLQLGGIEKHLERITESLEAIEDNFNDEVNGLTK